MRSRKRPKRRRVGKGRKSFYLAADGTPFTSAAAPPSPPSTPTPGVAYLPSPPPRPLSQVPPATFSLARGGKEDWRPEEGVSLLATSFGRLNHAVWLLCLRDYCRLKMCKASLVHSSSQGPIVKKLNRQQQHHLASVCLHVRYHNLVEK